MEVLQTSPLTTWVRRPAYNPSGARKLTHYARPPQFTPGLVAGIRDSELVEPESAGTFSISPVQLPAG
jgi:hypothetical protein